MHRSITRALRQTVCVTASIGMLAGCAPGSMTTQSQRIGYDDGTDSCRRELVALDSTGNFFAEDILKGAAVGALGGALIGGLAGGGRGALIGAAAGGAAGAAGGYFAALQGQARDQAGMLTRAQADMQAEGVQIDKAQIAFSQLADCRFYQARAIRNAYATGQMPKPVAVQQMAVVRERSQRDLALAQTIDKQITDRGEQFDVAADNLSPGTKAALLRKPPPRTVVTRRAVPIKLQPTDSSPELASAKPRDRVTVEATHGDYALVQTSSGTRGYASLSSLQLPPSRDPPPAATGGGEVRSLAGSNATRRDSFAQSVAVVQAQSSTFEIAG